MRPIAHEPLTSVPPSRGGKLICGGHLLIALRRQRVVHAGSMSLPFFDRAASVHAARLKQQGRRFPLFIFEMLSSTRRLRVSGSWVALTQRTHSHRAIGVIALQRPWIF